MIDKFISMTEVLSYLKAENIIDIEERSNIIQAFIEKEIQRGMGNVYDRYLEHGAATTATVITPVLKTNKKCIMWNVNHYLSLNRNEKVIEKAYQAMRMFGTGCGTSAVSCGMNLLHKEIEARVAKMVGKEQAVLFPTGFTTNLGAISGLVGDNDLILLDSECHSSIINGSRLTKAKKIAFKHNDISDLEVNLKRYAKSYTNIFVIVESAYSMSGDISPLKEIIALKKYYRFYLYVDEAHTFGFYGDKGQGYCYDQGVTDQVDFIMATLSKSTASIGGFFASTSRYCSLIRWTPTYMFQACLTPQDAAVILACLDEIESHPEMIRELHTKNQYMRNLLKKKNFNLGQSQSPIIPIMIQDPAKLLKVVDDLWKQGIYSTPILYPAVAKNEGRIRLILNVGHTKEQIQYTVDMLEVICKRNDADCFV